MALGVIFMIAGVIALGSVVMATASAVLIVGIMMIMAGRRRDHRRLQRQGAGARLIFWVLLGALYVAAGIICHQQPVRRRRPSSP